MKITLPKNYKDYFTVNDVEIAKRVIKEVKTWDSLDYTAYALQDVLPDGVWFEKTLEATFEICRDSATDNAYFEGSNKIDIWVEATAETSEGFAKIGFILSESWSIGGDNHMTRYNLRRYTLKD